MFWEANAEAWLKEPKPMIELTDDSYASRPVGSKQKEIICENENCCRSFSTRKRMWGKIIVKEQRTS